MKPGAAPPFATLFREHYAFVHRSLRGLGVAAEAVEDAAQEVFLVIHRRLADYDGRASIRAWAFGIARRVAHDFRRSHQRQQHRLSLVTPRPNSKSHSNAPSPPSTPISILWMKFVAQCLSSAKSKA